MTPFVENEPALAIWTVFSRVEKQLCGKLWDRDHEVGRFCSTQSAGSSGQIFRVQLQITDCHRLYSTIIWFDQVGQLLANS